MEDYKLLYEEVLHKFTQYKISVEKEIQKLKLQNLEVEQKLNNISNIVEIGKYINSSISSDNLTSRINDMIVGIFGATYSTIYLNKDGEMTVKVTNSNICEKPSKEIELYIRSGREFVINYESGIYPNESVKSNIHSIMGTPICIRNELVGYIVVEHTLMNFFEKENLKFMAGIASQTAIAIENANLYGKLQEVAIKDPLLSIYNRRYFYNFIECRMNLNRKRRFSIVMIDIDDFKVVNDTYGHQCGDEVLRFATEIIKQHLSETDILARYGGEEIIIYIEEFESEDRVFERIEGIRQHLCSERAGNSQVPIYITASFGISFYPNDGDELDDVVEVADKMLYKVKQNNKNGVLSSAKECVF